VTKEVSVNEKTQMLVVQDIEQPYISCADTADAGIMLNFSADSTNLPGWDISQYYWNFGDETIATGKNVEKSFNRPGTYSIQLIVSSKPEPGGIIKEACVSKNISIKRRP
jgi:PKD repeat protein